MIRRFLQPRILAALADTPILLLVGARQAGKTTLARALIEEGVHDARYLTLDAPAVLEAATGDPAGFVRGLEGPVILDEVQRAPELFLPIKQAVDSQRVPGSFLLTGSANVLLQPALSDALVGRLEALTLWPLAAAEIEGNEGNFVDALFAASLGDTVAGVPREQVAERLVRGGFPEVLARPDEDRQDAWLDSYIAALMQRDIRDLARIEALRSLPRLLGLLAARSGALLNTASLSRDAGLPQTTLRRYLTLFEATYLVSPLPSWSANLGKRLVKSPKLYMVDTGVLCHLVGVRAQRLLGDGNLLGPVLETFVVGELTRQVSWSRTLPRLHHYRTHAGAEIDIILESRDGRVAAVEVKAAASVRATDFKSMRFLMEKLDQRFVAGVVLYLGDEVVPFGERLWALPVAALWS
jgi:predicted AAA+ superfamily ATPase